MTLSGIEPATLWQVAYSLTHVRHHVPLNVTLKFKFLTETDTNNTFLKYKHKSLLQKTIRKFSGRGGGGEFNGIVAAYVATIPITSSNDM